MKRRNFLKFLSAIPVIGLPALAKPDNAVSLAQPRYVGTKTWWEDGKFRSKRITREEFYK